MQAIEFTFTDEKSVTASMNGYELWKYNHIPDASGQPCFHPVNTPAGHTISLLSPWDHVHHAGLWFAWKLIDGLNAWEGPGHPPYEVRISPIRLEPHEAGFEAEYEWHSQDGRVLLNGTTTCESHALAADAYAIDLSYEFATPGDKPVLLDRNPPPISGYGGFSFRPVRAFREAKYIDADGRTEPPDRGTPTAWHAYSGPIDGGLNWFGGIALMDSPGNPRYPSPSYTMHESQDFSFMHYAFLYDEPYELEPGTPLRLSYRVVVFEGGLADNRLQEWFLEFAN
ncbi:MAG: PmoA family protein [Thermomicrobiales bacterium]